MYCTENVVRLTHDRFGRGTVKPDRLKLVSQNQKAKFCLTRFFPISKATSPQHEVRRRYYFRHCVCAWRCQGRQFAGASKDVHEYAEHVHKEARLQDSSFPGPKVEVR